MESILVFNGDNYLIYSRHNRLFLNEIADLAKTNKLVNQECKSKTIYSLQHNSEEFTNLIVLIFGPYVASIRLLRDNCPKVQLFEERQMQIITRNYLDYMFLLIFDKTTNDKQLNEMNRKLDIFVHLAKLFYGVSINELENEQSHEVLSFLEFNLKCWEQSKDTLLFKLNSIEKLIINEQIKTELEKMILTLMEEINEEPLLKEIPFQSLVYVNDMLICNYKRPNSPRILHSDLILITLMVKTYFCCLSDIENRTLISSDSDYIASDDELDLSSYCDNPYCDLNEFDHNHLTDEQNQLQPDYDYFLNLNNDLNKLESNRSIVSRLAESDRYLFDDCEHQLIFLHSYIDRTNLVPFLIRFMRINNELLIVTLSELPSTFLYYYTNKLLILFNGLQYSNPKYYGFQPLNQLESSIKKMQNCLDFIGNEKNSKRNQQNAKLLKQKIDKFMKSDFRKYVIGVGKNFQLSSYLEALVSSICVQLKELTNSMIFTHHHNQLNIFRSITINKLSKLKKSFIYQLRDYLTFIWVKSRRNVPIEPYCNLVSNLVSFIYVDRNVNEFIFSASDCLSKESNLYFDLNAMIYKAYQLLKTNQTMQSRWQENRFIFNHAIWFEDQNGKLLNCNDKNFTLKSIPHLSRHNFIEEIVTQCFPSYKLVVNRELDESLSNLSISNSSRQYSILRCYEIFYVQIKNANQKVFSLEGKSVSNEEKFLLGNNCLNSLDLIQSRRLGKKIAQALK